jgi:hypothetical protein
MKAKIALSYKMAFAVLAAAIIALNACPAHAKLGDNYATIRHMFGEGVAKGHWVYWYTQETQNDIWMQFRNNHVVVVQWDSHNGPFYDSEIWRQLSFNSNGAYWTEYPSDTAGSRYFKSVDGTMYASLWENGTKFQIAYKEWIDRHHLWNTEDGTVNGTPKGDSNAQAPTQDG